MSTSIVPNCQEDKAHPAFKQSDHKRSTIHLNFILILLCLLSGSLLRSLGIAADGSHKGLNVWLIYLAIPATALLYVPQIKWSTAMVWPVAMPLIVFAGSLLVLSRLKVGSRARKGALLLGCALGNTSFVGFPLTQAYYGDEGLRIAVVCDQISFLLLSTFGVALAITYGQSPHRHGILKGLMRFPPFIAFLVALVLPGLTSLGELPRLWQALANTMVPVALFSVGLQLRITPKALDKTLAYGLLYKLMLAPACTLLILIAAGARGVVAQTTVMEAGMASMTTASVIAVEYGLDPELSSLLVGVGVPLSLITSHLWWRVGISIL